jgi:hypothetical protein
MSKDPVAEIPLTSEVLIPPNWVPEGYYIRQSQGVGLHVIVY